MRLWEDDEALNFEMDAPDTSWARDLKVSMDRGDINQCSFSFVARDEEWTWATPGSGELDERTIKDVKLFDVSIVTYPAYLDTEASVRSANAAREGARENARNRAEEIRQSKIDIMRRRLALKEKEF